LTIRESHLHSLGLIFYGKIEKKREEIKTILLESIPATVKVLKIE
jgi:hypothetical protein